MSLTHDHSHDHGHDHHGHDHGHDHQHGHEHSHGQEDFLCVGGGPKANFLVGFLGGIAGIALVAVAVLVWVIFK